MELKTFETERLVLKIANSQDAEFFLKLYNEPKFIKYIGDRKLKTKEDAANYITQKFQPQFEKMGFGNYVIVTKSDKLKIGAVGIFIRDGFAVPDIGFSVLKDYHNLGYAFEAAEALKTIIFRDFKLKKLSAITTQNNISSQKLIEKLGLNFIKMVEFPGDEDLLRYYES